MIRFEDVSVTYEGAARPAVAGVDFEVPEGELVLLAGPSGVGKSTVLGAVSGLVPHFTGGTLRGRVTVAGRDTRTHPPRQLADVVGTVGQDPLAHFVTDTVEDELAYGMESLGLAPAVMRRRVEETLDLLGLAGLRGRPIATLSGGQRQRVAIGSVLTPHPQVLVLDEPTSALDPAAAEEVLAVLQRLVHDLGTTVLMAEHRLERVIQYADRVVLLPAPGAAPVTGPPAEVMAVSPVYPPVVALGRLAGWSPLPLTVRDARRQAPTLRALLSGATAPAKAPAAPVTAGAATTPPTNTAAAPASCDSAAVATTGHTATPAEGAPTDVAAGRRTTATAAGTAAVAADDPADAAADRDTTATATGASPAPATGASGVVAAGSRVAGAARVGAAAVPRPRGQAAPAAGRPPRRAPGTPARRSLFRRRPAPAPEVPRQHLAETRALSVRRDQVQALRDIDLTVAPGETVALMGRNGAGKSTLLGSLVGLVAPSSGTVDVDGAVPHRTPPRDLVRRVGLVPQEPRDLLYADTVATECAAADRDAAAAPGTCRALVSELLPGVPDDTHPRDLSEGQRLALALAVVLTARPPLLLLDEPTRGLDYAAKARLVAVLRDLAAEGHAIVLATHDVELAAELAHRVVLLAEGEVIADGPTAEIVVSSPSFAPQVTKILAPQQWLTVAQVREALT
ncbi:ATPase [Streptomyces sp. Ru62]|uniref:ATP-binding cassette domain-containing protein n=1 Tax=Streptomyces sp. Ru62 TaxID=2080745 RepID=UPI000CDD93BF|nr:ATP-binding cassette domain-containing protein [Streptomyces sp. Ru62]POX64221.1 ATPase [Streptomyces sp. Ru62]